VTLGCEDDESVVGIPSKMVAKSRGEGRPESPAYRLASESGSGSGGDLPFFEDKQKKEREGKNRERSSEKRQK